jgi:hypothetical protein
MDRFQRGCTDSQCGGLHQCADSIYRCARNEALASPRNAMLPWFRAAHSVDELRHDWGGDDCEGARGSVSDEPCGIVREVARRNGDASYRAC